MANCLLDNRIIRPLYDKLNVGCGEDYREGFVNIDGNTHLPKVDYILDIKPGVLQEFFEKESFNLIVANDFVEHHFHWEAHKLLHDFNVLLKKGGILDIRLPDVEGIKVKRGSQNMIVIAKKT